MAGLREIVEEQSFRESLEELGVDPKRLDDLMRGITFTMARVPEAFFRVKGTRLRRATVYGALGVPPLWIWFTHNAETIQIIRAELIA